MAATSLAMSATKDKAEACLPFLTAVARSFNDPKYSDLTIECDGTEWKVHKISVCSQSSFFEKACRGNFKEGKENRITFPTDFDVVVGAMLQCLYTFDYPIPSAMDINHPLLFNLSVYVAADKYDIPNLCKLAIKKFVNLAWKEWKSPEFAEAVERIYTEINDSGRQLRDAVESIATAHATELRTAADFCKVVSKVPALGLDLWCGLPRALESIQKDSIVYKNRCRNCSFAKHARTNVPTAFVCTACWTRYPEDS